MSTPVGTVGLPESQQHVALAAKHDLLAPVRAPLEADAPVQPGMGLCLSGGGYRAMLFHAGSLLRLNEAGYLPRLARISSVSGGSIVSAVLGTRWSELGLDRGAVGQDFERIVVDPLRALASKTLDIPCVVRGWMSPRTTINDRLGASYRKELFGSKTLQDLPESPDFMFNATNLQTGDLWRFSRRLVGDWRVGTMRDPDFDLGRVVAASSAFPPVLSPAIFTIPDGRLAGGADPTVARAPYTTRAVLADGGIYDNLGLETVWKDYSEVLISDGGGHMADLPRPGRMWSSQAVRVLHAIDNQVRDLRKRQAVTSFIAKTRTGAYWGIRSQVRDFELDRPLADPGDQAVEALAKVPTRLSKIAPATQEHLINWGYLICDTALRRWVDQSLQAGALPYPSAGFGPRA